jgi:hypothetical protein
MCKRCDELHAPASVTPYPESAVPIGYEVGSAPEPVFISYQISEISEMFIFRIAHKSTIQLLEWPLASLVTHGIPSERKFLL